MSETFEQMALRIWKIECGKTRACSTSKLTLMEITAIAFAAAIRDELAKDAESAAHLSEIWDGMIERRRSYSFVENRVVELKQECDELRRKIADIKRPDFHEMREMLRTMQAGELTVSRGIEILEIWAAGNWNDDMLPPVRQDLIEEDSMPVEIINRLKIEIESLRQQLAASQAREQKFRELLSNCIVPFTNIAMVKIAKWRVEEAFSTPNDTTALSAVVAKAGEVMREAAQNACKSRSIGTDHDDFDKWDYCNYECADAIRALPAITLDDLK